MLYEVITLDEFSMSAISVPRVKQIIRAANYAQAKAMADKALASATVAEVEAIMDSFVSEAAL